MIKKILSLCAVVLALCACSSNDEIVGLDDVQLTNQTRAPQIDAFEPLPFERTIFTVKSGNTRFIFGRYELSGYIDGEVRVYLGTRLVSQEELPGTMGLYSIQGVYTEGLTYTVTLWCNGAKIRSIDYTIPKTSNPGNGGGKKPEPFRPIEDGDLILQ